MCVCMYVHSCIEKKKVAGLVIIIIYAVCFILNELALSHSSGIPNERNIPPSLESLKHTRPYLLPALHYSLRWTMYFVEVVVVKSGNIKTGGDHDRRVLNVQFSYLHPAHLFPYHVALFFKKKSSIHCNCFSVLRFLLMLFSFLDFAISMSVRCVCVSYHLVPFSMLLVGTFSDCVCLKLSPVWYAWFLRLSVCQTFSPRSVCAWFFKWSKIYRVFSSFLRNFSFLSNLSQSDGHSVSKLFFSSCFVQSEKSLLLLVVPQSHTDAHFSQFCFVCVAKSSTNICSLFASSSSSLGKGNVSLFAWGASVCLSTDFGCALWPVLFLVIYGLLFDFYAFTAAAAAIGDLLKRKGEKLFLFFVIWFWFLKQTLVLFSLSLMCLQGCECKS